MLPKKAVLCFVCFVAAVPAWAATWTYVGSPQFVGFVGPNGQPYPATNGVVDRPLANEHPFGDYTRIKLSSLVVDHDGNLFVVTTRGNNDGEAGGVTIFKPDHTQVNIDVNSITSPNAPSLGGTGTEKLTGAVTKLVLAGDGHVYGVQNWLEINWSYNPGTVSRILRFDADGNVGVIKEHLPVSTGGNPWGRKIGGLAVGSDGNPYWWYSGFTAVGDGDKFHVLWRYNLWAGGGPVVEEYLKTANNNGGEIENRLLNFEYIGPGANGQDWFFVWGHPDSWADRQWSLDAISWTSDRNTTLPNGLSNPQWGRDFPTATAYDAARLKLWVGGRGSMYNDNTGGTQPWMDAGSCIMSRWTGTPGNRGMLSNGVNGIAGNTAWHANGNAVDSSHISNGGGYWVTTIGINPADGRGWMSYGGAIGNTRKDWYKDYSYAGDYGKIGNVYAVDPEGTASTPGGVIDEGRPQASHPTDGNHENQVLAIKFTDSGLVYALTIDLVNGSYSLYSATVTAPQTGACCGRANTCAQAAEGTCVLNGGYFHGTGSTCDQVDCRWRVCQRPIPDTDGDGDVDQLDFGIFQQCLTIGGGQIHDVTIDSRTAIKCGCYDTTGVATPNVPDGAIDNADLLPFELCGSGSAIPLTPGCSP